MKVKTKSDETYSYWTKIDGKKTITYKIRFVKNGKKSTLTFRTLSAANNAIRANRLRSTVYRVTTIIEPMNKES